MNPWYRGLILAVALVILLSAASGCARQKRRKITVIEEQREGPVTEQSPGEMIVE